MTKLDPLALRIAATIDAYRKEYPTLRVRRTVAALRAIADDLETALRKAA